MAFKAVICVCKKSLSIIFPGENQQLYSTRPHGYLADDEFQICLFAYWAGN